MWYTTSRYVSPIRFHCVSLTSCAVGVHSTFESYTKRPYRSCSLSAFGREQRPGREQCGLTKWSVVFLWSSNIVCWSLCPTSYVVCVTIQFACSPSGWLDCSSACCSLWPPEPSARAVGVLWGRLPAQEEGEGHADCKWQWMVEWIVHVPNHHVWLHSQDDCQPATVHEVAVNASGRSECCSTVLLSFCLLLCNSNWFACAHIIVKLCVFLAFV